MLKNTANVRLYGHVLAEIKTETDKAMEFGGNVFTNNYLLSLMDAVSFIENCPLKIKDIKLEAFRK